MPPLKAIAAMADNRVIGQGNRIPWHLPEDFQWFRQNTLGGLLIMGRKTFDAIGRPLPGRHTLVLSRNPAPRPDVTVLNSLAALARHLEADPRPAWVCGGAELYRRLLPSCSELLLSRVPGSPPGDAFFPPFEDRFVETGPAELRTGFSIHHYRNPNPVPIPTSEVPTS